MHQNVITVLEGLALIVTALGLPIAIVQLYIGRKQAQAGRDLEIILSLSGTFREHWEAGWDRALERLENAGEAALSAADEHELCSMLNWIDWLGNLIDSKHLAKAEAILNAIGAPMRRMIIAGRHVIERDMNANGRDYWHGLLVVADRLRVDVGAEPRE